MKKSLYFVLGSLVFVGSFKIVRADCSGCCSSHNHDHIQKEEQALFAELQAAASLVSMERVTQDSHEKEVPAHTVNLVSSEEAEIEATSEEVLSEEEVLRVLLEEDPFGEPSLDEDLVVAPKDSTERPVASASYQLLQRVSCALVASYLACIERVSSLWRAVKSLY